MSRKDRHVATLVKNQFSLGCLFGFVQYVFTSYSK